MVFIMMTWSLPRIKDTKPGKPVLTNLYALPISMVKTTPIRTIFVDSTLSSPLIKQP